MGNDKYMIVVDGSRRTTRKNRRCIRLFKPYDPTATEGVQDDLGMESGIIYVLNIGMKLKGFEWLICYDLSA